MGDDGGLSCLFFLFSYSPFLQLYSYRVYLAGTRSCGYMCVLCIERARDSRREFTWNCFSQERSCRLRMCVQNRFRKYLGTYGAA
jgi:hypothetical protein